MHADSDWEQDEFTASLLSGTWCQGPAVTGCSHGMQSREETCLAWD